MSCNIAASLVAQAQERGGETGLIEAGSGLRLSFQDLNRRSDSYAHILRHKGIEPGSRVMLMVKPSADFICLTFALFKIGAPVILIDPGMGYRNLLRCIKGVRPRGFIGIAKAHLLKALFRKPFGSVVHSLCCSCSLGIFGPNIARLADHEFAPYPPYVATERDLAAIIFTTGSTGPPKGVRYEHGIFQAQLRLIRDYYGIAPGQVDQPAFPLFALFSTALGASAVIPDMDPTRPAQVDPNRFVDSIKRYGVTYSFGSPAIWDVIARSCAARDPRLQSLTKVLMAGAPVSGDLIGKLQMILPQGAAIHTPYGATESLPIVSIEGREVVEETWRLSRLGHGTCVGRALPGIEIGIIAISDGVLSGIQKGDFLPCDQIGEIIVRGPVVTRAYENNEIENRLAKIPDGESFWHRMGDVGYLDSRGRLWFCGRRAHRVCSSQGGRPELLFTIPCEAIYNTHPEVLRSALVGVPGPGGSSVAVIIIEMIKTATMKAPELLAELRKRGAANSMTATIGHYLVHPEFPVDIRHNAKIFREKLSVWAATRLQGKL